MARDPLRSALQIGTYVLFYMVAIFTLGPLLSWLGGYLTGLAISGFLAAALCNSLCMRIYKGRGLTDIGLPWNRGAGRNFGMGLAAGAGSAFLVLAGPLLFHAARMQPSSDPGASWRAMLFVPLLLLCGAAGEEMLFHGFGFQVLVGDLGPFATVLPVGALFAALHSGNPNASSLGLLNTAGFGILFGLAFLRTHDLWLPMGIHLGWNFVLPLFGVNLSGITMRLTGYEIAWNAGPLWSGGGYGPEASILTSAVLAVLLIFLWKAPLYRQYAYLLDEARDQVEEHP